MNVVTQEGFTEYIPESKLDQDLTQEKDIAELASLLDDDLKQEASPVSEDASDAQISFPKRRFQGFKGIKTFIDAPVVGTSVNASSILENQAGITLQSHSHVLSTGAASTISISELMKNAIQDLSSKFTPSNKAVEKNEKVKPAPTAKTATPNSLLSLLKQISELDPAIEACGIIKGGEIAASAISSRLNNELAKEAIGAVLTVCDKYSNSMRMGQIMTVSITSQYGIFHIAEVQSGVFMYILTGSDTKQGLFNVVLKKIRSEIGRFL